MHMNKHKHHHTCNTMATETSAVAHRTSDRSILALPKAWRSPWVVVFVVFYLFAIPWIAFGIFHRYFIENDWNSALPGLAKTVARKMFMGSHMVIGAVGIVVAPSQFMGSIRRNYPKVHRVMGRIFVLAGIGACICGNIFIYLMNFTLVGGFNMALALALSGVVLAWFCYMCYHTATRQQWHSHRSWAIRAVGQMWAPALYRYWYSLVMVLGWRDPRGVRVNCDPDTDVCPYYLRAFDMIHIWSYWVSAWIVAECIIATLPKLKDAEGEASQRLLEKSESDGKGVNNARQHTAAAEKDDADAKINEKDNETNDDSDDVPLLQSTGKSTDSVSSSSSDGDQVDDKVDDKPESKTENTKGGATSLVQADPVKKCIKVSSDNNLFYFNAAGVALAVVFAITMLRIMVSANTLKEKVDQAIAEAARSNFS
mmetsp:Transcript_7356/g.19895  ORF Transcript_7356/g.19895 Transcript_7356/m.19895 type:complete len:426 (-) Transcript_7356:116-1393(-)